MKQTFSYRLTRIVLILAVVAMLLMLADYFKYRLPNPYDQWPVWYLVGVGSLAWLWVIWFLLGKPGAKK